MAKAHIDRQGELKKLIQLFHIEHVHLQHGNNTDNHDDIYIWSFWKDMKQWGSYNCTGT